MTEGEPELALDSRTRIHEFVVGRVFELHPNLGTGRSLGLGFLKAIGVELTFHFLPSIKEILGEEGGEAMFVLAFPPSAWAGLIRSATYFAFDIETTAGGWGPQPTALTEADHPNPPESRTRELATIWNPRPTPVIVRTPQSLTLALESRYSVVGRICIKNAPRAAQFGAVVLTPGLGVVQRSGFQVGENGGRKFQAQRCVTGSSAWSARAVGSASTMGEIAPSP